MIWGGSGGWCLGAGPRAYARGSDDGGGGFAFGFGCGVGAECDVVEGCDGVGCAVGGLGFGALVGGAAEAGEDGADAGGLEPIEQLEEGDVEDAWQVGEGVGGGEVGAHELALVQMARERLVRASCRCGLRGLRGHAVQGAWPIGGVKGEGVESAEGARGGGGW